MMIGRMFCYGSSELGNFDFFLVITLDTGKEDFALPGFEAVDQRWNRTLVVHVAEENEFLVDEIAIADILRVLLVKELLWKTKFSSPFALIHPSGEPLFALFDVFLAESHKNCFIITFSIVFEDNAMALHVGKVTLGLLRRRSTQPLVVLDTIARPVFSLGFPFFKFRKRIEAEGTVAFGGFDDWSNEFFQER